MNGIQEIEQAIARLPRDEFFKLREHLQSRFDDEWDAEFERDVASGKFDKIAAQALAEHRAGKSKPFPL